MIAALVAGCASHREPMGEIPFPTVRQPAAAKPATPTVSRAPETASPAPATAAAAAPSRPQLPPPLPTTLGGPQLPSGEGGIAKVGNPYRVEGKTYIPTADASGYSATGIASWYGKDFHGKRTANGEMYDMHALSAAHPTLPLPTMVRVTNLENGQAVVVRVNDRGPFKKDRLIDLSYAAANVLGYANRGTTQVRVETLDIEEQPVTPSATMLASNAAPTTSPAAPQLTAAIFVQVGAFSVPANAERLQAELAREHANVRIYLSEHKPKPFYRVRIGPLPSSRDIERTIRLLQQSGHNEAMVVVE